MNAYVSTELSMIQMLDPHRHELALLQEDFLNKGGTIEVLQGPSFIPPPTRHEPPPTVKAKPAKQVVETTYIDKITQRDIDREERAAQRAKDKVDRIDRIRKLAETMTYAQAVLCTGLARRTLQSIAAENGFKFQPSANNGRNNVKPNAIDEARDAKYAERIKSFMEVGLSRNQAMVQLGITFKTFARLLNKFDIDYPKRRAGPHPAFFPKTKEASQ